MSSLNKKPVLSGKKKTDDAHPFGVLWLNSLFQEVILPNGDWQKLALKVNDAFAERIRKQFDHAHRKQMLFDLMGFDYVQAYFPNEEYNPALVEPPQVTPEERKKLQVDAQNWLQKELTELTTELGCQRIGMKQPDAGAPLCREMQDFLRFVRVLSAQNLNRHLYLHEQQLLKEWENYQYEKKTAKEQEREEERRIKLQREYERITGTAGLKSILRGGVTPAGIGPGPPLSAASIFTTTPDISRTTSNIKGALYGAEEDPPNIASSQSDCIGRSIVGLLKRDPRRFTEVASSLHGRQLPTTLRMYIWLDVLLRAERERLQDINAERLVRERFGKTLSRGISDLKVKRATHSPISSLIDTAVIETYDKTPGMRMYLEQDQHMKEAAKTLNILYVYDRTYEPYLVYWLFPLQMAFDSFSGQSDHMYDLAMYLDLLNKSCFPSWPQVFAIAESTMLRLAQKDQQLYDHLERVSLVHVNINPKEFLVQMIHEEKAKADALLSLSPGPKKSKQMSKELLANPRIFLRKWVGEGFASILDSQAALFVWDQCFMQRWQPRVMEDFCLAILLLLRHKFLEAEEYRDIKRVFLREPCRLYTLDIQRAWVHIQRGGPLSEVSNLNRQKPSTVPEVTPVAQSPARRHSPAPSMLSLKPIPILGLKHLRVKIDIRPEKLTFFRQITPSSIKLNCSVYFGSVRLSLKSSTTDGLSTGIETDRNGATSLLVTYPKLKFVYDSLDATEYDLEQELGGYPYAVIQVNHISGASPTPLGWARIKLFQHKSSVKGWVDPNNPTQWVLIPGDSWYKLFPGDAAEITPTGATPDGLPNRGALIGDGSELGVLVYDPNSEPVTPLPMSTPSPRTRQSPVQKPRTPTPKQPSPKPKIHKRQTPVQSEPPQTPELPGIKDKFALYVDGVDNIPDNATITKLTGRILKTGALTGLHDLLCPPELTSPARCPRYAYKFPINENEKMTDVDMLVLLRVYTVDRMTGDLLVIGSALCQVFDKQTGKIRAGGHQRVLRYGMPDLKKGIGAIEHTALDTAPRIPGCTVYYRILPLKQQDEPPPLFNLANYPLDDRMFNASEQNVLDSFTNDSRHPRTVADMITRQQRVENVSESGKEVESMDNCMEKTEWLLDRLDQKTRLGPNQAAGYLPLNYMVRYRLDKGLNVHIAQAVGLPEGLYTNCFAQVYPGQGAQGMQPTPEGWGKEDEKFATFKIELDSHQVAPEWHDPAKTIHPHHDPYTVLMIQVFGLRIKYSATTDHREAGPVTDDKGAPLQLGEESIIGWAIVPLFDELYSSHGEHHVPLFSGKPDQNLLSEFSKKPADQVIAEHNWTKTNKLNNASLVVNVWDGHFSEVELLEPLQRHEDLLVAVGSKEQYSKAEKDIKGHKLNQIVMEGLTKKDQKEGANGEVYLKEKELFADSMSKKFLTLMEDALMQAGYGPL